MNALLPPTCEADSSVEAYESLRAHVLTGSGVGSPSGLLLLLRQGVAAWTARRSSRPLSPHPVSPLAEASPTNELHAAVVRVLASIALANRESLPA